MISGRDALLQIEQAISGARDDENRLDAALASATDDATRARAAQAAAYRALAKVRLDALSGDQVATKLDRAEKQALAVLAERRRALEEIAQRRTTATKSLADAQSKRHGVAGRLEDVVHRMDDLRAATQTRLASDKDWLAANEKVVAAQTLAGKAEDKAKQAEADRVTKGAPYEADKLFMYLWRNGFGTSRYAAGNVVRYFDRKVAAVCGFIDARPNYAMLNEIPLRLREHAAHVVDDVTAATAARTAIERAALEDDGIVGLESEFAAVRAEIDAGNAGIASVQSDLAALDASHGALIDDDDPTVKQALDGVAESLAAADLQTLYAQAFATPTPEDEKIVRQIEECGNAIAKAEAEVEATRETIRQTAQRRADLEQTRDRFRNSGYDRPGVTFNNESMLGNIIGGVIGGLVSSPDLWRVILGGYQAPTRRSGDIFGGGPGFPGGGDTNWWGGGSGQSGGSSGGFGGDSGGFTTGGGFGGDSNSTSGGF